MKSILLAGTLVLASLTAFSQELSPEFPVTLASDVIAQHETVVGFAPEEYRGLFVLQITESGEVRYINNKKEVSTLAVLSAELVGKLQKSIDAIETTALRKPDGDMVCADAPSEVVRVVNSNGQTITTYRNVDCRHWYAEDTNAADAARAVDALELALTSMNHLGM